MTQAEAVDWLNAQIGKHLDYDKLFGQQCVDFFNFYYQALTGASPYAEGYGVNGAKDLWFVPTSKFMKIPDSPELVPQPGDVLIYGSTWGGGYGHVDVCISSDAGGVWLLGENEHGNPQEGVVKIYRNWTQLKGLTGVMRPQFKEGVNNMPTLTSTLDLDFLYPPMVGRARGAGEGEDVYLNKDYRFVAMDLYKSPEATKRRADKQAELDNLQSQVAVIPALQSKISDLGAVATNQQKQIDSLKASLAATSGDTDILNSFGKALAALIARLGLSK